ncbi:hypothetical protein Mgra_00000648 [Meloidogyne graminicola]|uniref:Ubiquitin n=1 Tax=Meloidogyne graminicola TaxID=189291 RepID=A0A8T0A1M6_9BILA|nr:hypothetical protein Mgra_00000648 [Meloidogyne graminicola]
MVHYKFGRCTICCKRLSRENVYILKNCNHTYHEECIKRWISRGSQTCPRCVTHTTLGDIKKLFVEEAGDTSQDSDNELDKGSSNITPQASFFGQQRFNSLNQYIQVIVRDMNNVKITLQLKPTSTVREMKNMINGLRGIHVDTQRLIYFGNQLEDDRTLSFYKIGNNSIVDLVLRQKGGK